MILSSTILCEALVNNPRKNKVLFDNLPFCCMEMYALMILEVKLPLANIYNILSGVLLLCTSDPQRKMVSQHSCLGCVTSKGSMTIFRIGSHPFYDCLHGWLNPYSLTSLRTSCCDFILRVHDPQFSRSWLSKKTKMLSMWGII